MPPATPGGGSTMQTPTINATTQPAIGADQLRAAMLEVIAILAADVEVPAVEAARLPVSLGSAFADLCDRLGIAAPAVVWDALG